MNILSNCLSRQILKTALFIFFAGYISGCIYALFFYGSDIVSTFARCGSDEFHFLDNTRIMFEELIHLRIKGFLYNCYSFGYGIVYWIILFFATLPGFLLDNQRLIVLGGRFVSLFFSLGTFFLVYVTIKNLFKKDDLIVLLSLVPSLLSFQLFTFQTIVHPETVYIFFIFLALFFLQKDKGAFGSYFLLACSSWTLSLSAKVLAIFSAPIFLIYIIYNKTRLTSIIKGMAIGALSLMLINFPLFFPLIRIRFFNWLVGMSGRSSCGSISIEALQGHFFALNDGYLNFFVLGICFLIILIFEFFELKNKINLVILFPNVGISLSFLSLFWIYLIVSFSCCRDVATIHYGLPLLYAFPFLVMSLLKRIDNVWPLYALILQILLICLLPLKFFAGSNQYQLALPSFCLLSSANGVESIHDEAFDAKRDMDVAASLFKKYFSYSDKRLLVRGNPAFGLIWPSIHNPPIYLSLYDLEDQSLVEADVVILRVRNVVDDKSRRFFTFEQINNTKLLRRFFKKIYDDGRLLMFERVQHE
ncbi:hypothetical protein FJ364_03310 [Candidatus Dependentiae bacterium]|nr:hypothetical protein [Candidatus Dependentiae bacterium]